MNSRPAQPTPASVALPAARRSGVSATGHADVYLQPGQLIAARTPTAIKTILGSCVAVCLWDAQAQVGGMNHYLLPYGSARHELPDRFGNCAITRLIDAVTQHGGTRASMRAKVFGGAAVIGTVTRGVARIGAQNAQVALELLELAGIPVVGRDLGGERGRKIVFHTDTGKVSLWEL